MMTNQELENSLLSLIRKAEAARDLHPMLAAGKMKDIAEESLAIVTELVQRELLRERANG